MPDGFDTLEAAALAAMREAVPMSEKYEYAGALYVGDDGKFHYTPPASSEGRRSVKVKVRYPKGAKLAGLYHTHPEGDQSETFSTDDVEIADKLELPYYMGHYADGAARVYQPGKTSTFRSGKFTTGVGRRSKGDLIGNVFDEDPEQPKPAAIGPPL